MNMWQGVTGKLVEDSNPFRASKVHESQFFLAKVASNVHYI